MGQSKLAKKVLPIAHLGDPVLRRRNERLSEDEISSEEMQKFVDRMCWTCKVHKGAGLAAPQVGRNIQLFIISAETVVAHAPIVIFNPTVVLSGNRLLGEEGCLSVPKIYGEVARSEKVKISYLNQHAEERSISLSGFSARVAQHECDHLVGQMFTDIVLPASLRIVPIVLVTSDMGR